MSAITAYASQHRLSALLILIAVAAAAVAAIAFAAVSGGSGSNVQAPTSELTLRSDPLENELGDNRYKPDIKQQSYWMQESPTKDALR